MLPQPILLRNLRDVLDIVPAPEVPLRAATGALWPLRVLVAEDNATNRLLVERMLRPLPLAIAFVENGAEAIEAYVRLRPEIVLTDISMPVMDGKEATRRIRALEAAEGWPRAQFVAVTAHAILGDAEDILAAGIDAYVTKPFQKAELVGHLAAVVGAVHLPFDGPAAALGLSGAEPRA